MTDHKRYMKPKMLCPVCQKQMTINGMTTHIRMKHPEFADEFQANKDTLIQKFRVDSTGALIADPNQPPIQTTKAEQEVSIQELPDPPEQTHTPPSYEHEVISETTPPTPPTPIPTNPPEPKVPPTEKFHKEEDDTEEHPKQGYFYDPYGFGR